MSGSPDDDSHSSDTITASMPTESSLLADAGIEQLVLQTPEGEIVLDFEDGEFTLGRDTLCDLILNTRFVSRVHARIARDRGRFFFLEDLSRNGTTIKPEGSEQRVLRHGDRIALIGTGLIGLGEMARPDGKAIIAYSVVRRRPE